MIINKDLDIYFVNNFWFKIGIVNEGRYKKKE